MFWYVLTADDLGNFWDGPYAEEILRQEAAAGQLSGDIALQAIDGRVMSVREAFTPRASGWATLGKIALAGLGIYVGAKAVGGIAQYFSDTKEQRSIRRSAHQHAARGAEVCADHIGWDCTPPLMGRRRADVVADYGDVLFVEEHETEESVDRRHSIEQDRDLRRWASRRPNVDYRQIIA